MFEEQKPQPASVPSPAPRGVVPPPPPRQVTPPAASQSAAVEDMFADVKEMPAAPGATLRPAAPTPTAASPATAAMATASGSSALVTALKFGLGFVVLVGAVGGTVYVLSARSKEAAQKLPQVAPVVETPSKQASVAEPKADDTASTAPLVVTPLPDTGAGAAAPNAEVKEPIPVRDTDMDGLSDDQERVFGTDPTAKDTDGDKLSDYDEVINYGTNPLQQDSDSDGLTDFDEVKTYKTDPKKMDTDGDSYTDKMEVDNGYNPNGEGKLPAATPAPAPTPAPQSETAPQQAPTPIM